MGLSFIWKAVDGVNWRVVSFFLSLVYVSLHQTNTFALSQKCTYFTNLRASLSCFKISYLSGDKKSGSQKKFQFSMLSFPNLYHSYFSNTYLPFLLDKLIRRGLRASFLLSSFFLFLVSLIFGLLSCVLDTTKGGFFLRGMCVVICLQGSVG